MTWFPSDRATRRRIYMTALINIISGLYVGYSIGFPAVYMTYNQLSTDCETYLTTEACLANSQAECVWSSFENNNVSAVPMCRFSDLVNCSIATTEDECGALPGSSCTYSNKKCSHVHGWNAKEQGVFAASMIIGGTVGALPIGTIMDRIGRPRSFLLLGAFSSISCGLMHLGCYLTNFPFFVVANALAGMPIGAIQVLAPMYVGEMTPAAWSLHVGILIQVGITFGIFMMGVYGFAVKPSDEMMHEGASYDVYFQITIAGLLFLSLVVGAIGFLIPESVHYLQLIGAAREEDENGADDESAAILQKGDDVAQNRKQNDVDIINTNAQPTSSSGAATFAAYSNLPFDTNETTCFGWRKTHVLCFVVSTATSACLSLTGINSFIVYAPVIMQSAGMSSLAGNLIVDGWNFVTTLVSLPLAFRCNTTQMFNVGAVLVTGTCVISGVLLYPGVIVDETVRNWILIFAVLMFIAAFEIGMATGYYVIAQALFPSDARSIGTGYTIAIQYLFNVMIIFLYPVGLDAFSPGDGSGSTQRGMSVWLLIYGSIGVVTTILLIKYLGNAQYIAAIL
ncbi:glucose transporter, putative [Bodo saltans]|uniref:Glucose transporter, putative n=1 Tax=Bodo saltans TaxID=75058 RepID=A0A0S4J363_BODSA|nr:glucose transporter, putative [Bodo saltans]|eukprot:CUG85761.1 glucose transporter, putative [Bodo saltans]